MKARRIPEDRRAFKPVTIELTFESEQELAAFYTILNYTPISQAAQTIDPEFKEKASDIRRTVGPIDQAKYWDGFITKIECCIK